MYCKNCGEPLKDNDRICPACGAPVVDNTGNTASTAYTAPAGGPQTYNYQGTNNQYNYSGQPYQVSEDSGSIGWGLLGCCIPLVGLILFLVWKDTKPLSAKKAGIGAIVGVVLGIVLYFVLIVAMGVGAGILGTAVENGDMSELEDILDSLESMG